MYICLTPCIRETFTDTFTSSTDPDEMSHNVASSQGPHCFFKINISKKNYYAPSQDTIDFSKFSASNQQYTKGQVISYQFFHKLKHAPFLEQNGITFANQSTS